MGILKAHLYIMHGYLDIYFLGVLVFSFLDLLEKIPIVILKASVSARFFYAEAKYEATVEGAQKLSIIWSIFDK